MIDKIRKISSRRIILGTAFVLIALFLIRGLTGFITESSARKSGSLESFTLTGEDFEWNGIQIKNNVAVTTDNDPQMTLAGERKFTSLEFYMESSMYPGEIVLYYTEPGETAFSVHKRLWALPTEKENWYIVETGIKNVTGLRLDPTMYAGNILTFGDFVFNREKSFGDYFEISYVDVYNLIVYTGIISSVLKFLQEMLKKQID